MPDGLFVADLWPRSGWTHITLNFIGPDDGQGIRIYLDGTQASSDVTKSNYNFSSGDGRVSVGRMYSGIDAFYADVDVDELFFFNAQLFNQQILDIIHNA